ncbi:MAG: glycine/betaine/sarcosine/D-proline family reductase selenoprotein B [Actinomycetia bacterium]|nr:glycine/betaine/sarcosine/D-proline family reductase selenoprotein B [Actinomycetes bacterium]
MDTTETQESFESFRRSFSYGARNDLNFKFLKSLTDEEAGQFFQDLLHLLGDAYDSGDVAPLIERAYEAQVAGYNPSPSGPPPKYLYQDGPFSAAETAVANARLGLLTTSGHFLKGDDPEPFGEPALTQNDAVARIGDFLTDHPTLSEIPSKTPGDDLRVRHGGYDIRAALKDPNVTFPIDRLNEAATQGRIQELAPTFYSFPGATAQGRLRRELPGWIDRIKSERVDYMLLVPV